MGYVWMSGQPACLSGHIAGGLLYTNGIYVRYYTALVPTDRVCKNDITEYDRCPQHWLIWAHASDITYFISS